MRNPTPFLAAGALAVLALFASVYVVNESQTAIVLNLGKVVRSDVAPGLHFKVPCLQPQTGVSFQCLAAS